MSNFARFPTKSKCVKRKFRYLDCVLLFMVAVSLSKLVVLAEYAPIVIFPICMTLVCNMLLYPKIGGKNHDSS
jgi:hypothetical protein